MGIIETPKNSSRKMVEPVLDGLPAIVIPTPLMSVKSDRPYAPWRKITSGPLRPADGELRFDMSEAEFTYEGDKCTFEVPRRGQSGEPPPAVAPRIVFVHVVGRRPALDKATDDVKLALPAHRRRVMQRTWNGGAAALAIGRRIADFEFALAADSADNVDFPAHLNHRHLGTGGGHWRANGPMADAFCEGLCSAQGTAGQQPASEQRRQR
jgi:hypothetical protein